MQKINAHTVPAGRGLPLTQQAGTESVSVSDIYKHLNFKVTPEFHREFKTFAASHDISMTALLMESFNILREQHSA